MLRNGKVSAEAIAEGGFKAVAAQAQAQELLLALEDSTSLSYAHGAAERLGPLSNTSTGRRRGWQAHSIVLVNAQTGSSLGLIEQTRWIRQESNHGQKHARKQRAYVDKESFKWERASRRMAERLGRAMERTITVCDRESDVYEYLAYKQSQGQRYVIRAKEDRRLEAGAQRLFATLDEAPELGRMRVKVAQRGGRAAREAEVTLHAAQVRLSPPHGLQSRGAVLSLGAVLVREPRPPAGQEPLCWRLLTSEPVSTEREARTVVGYYARRWHIEEFHKAWKSGAGVERQRMQSVEGLERMVVLTAFVAVRLLQLQEALDALPGETAPACCEPTLSRLEWRVLWATSERSRPPASAPSRAWAYRALARLGGFGDTKRTGRAGWITLWRGWARLQEQVEAYALRHLLDDEAM